MSIPFKKIIQEQEEENDFEETFGGDNFGEEDEEE